MNNVLMAMAGIMGLKVSDLKLSSLFSSKRVSDKWTGHRYGGSTGKKAGEKRKRRRKSELARAARKVNRTKTWGNA